MKKKVILLMFLSIGFFQMETNAQIDTAMIQDSLTWHIYVPGRPNMNYLDAQKAVAQKWGVKVEYLFGDCVGTHDEKGKAFESENQLIFSRFEEQYGKDWEANFQDELAKKMKR